MNDETLHKQLDEALAKINALPENQRAPLLAMVNETRDRHQQLKENFARISSAMDEWRLNMKYLEFDREASHREIAELRKRLGEQSDM